MTVSISWVSPYHNILNVQLCGKWTWFDLQRTGQKIRQEVEARSGYVDVIIDMQNAASAPVHNDHDTLHHMLETMPRNYGVMVFSGADKFTEMILGILKNSAPIIDRKIMIASAKPEALNLIAERRETRAPARSQ